MTDMRESFLADIVEHPGDDAPRLIYADWLEDHGDPQRAEFIRVQVELEPLRSHGHGSNNPAGAYCHVCFRAAQLERREAELLDANAHDWLFELPPGMRPLLPDAIRDTFRRGFVSRVRCTLSQWCGYDDNQSGAGSVMRVPGHGPALVRRLPLERVEISDRRPQHYPGSYPSPWAWHWAEDGEGHLLHHSHPTALPKALWDCLPKEPARTQQESLDHLSAGCLLWARSQVLNPHR